MADKQIKQPGPDHPITIEQNPARIVVSVAGRVIANTKQALTLREANYPPVKYIPLEDVDTSLLERRTTPPTAPTRETAATSASQRVERSQ